MPSCFFCKKQLKKIAYRVVRVQLFEDIHPVNKLGFDDFDFIVLQPVCFFCLNCASKHFDFHMPFREYQSNKISSYLSKMFSIIKSFFLIKD